MRRYERSDIDIVVDSRGELRGLKFCGMLENVVLTLGKRVDMIDLRSIKPGLSIMEDVLRGIVLYER